MNRERLLTITAMICVGLLLTVYLVINPLAANWESRSQKIERLSRRIKQGEQLLARERVYQADWREMRENSLPENTGQAELLVQEAMNRWVDASGINVLTRQPRWNDVRDLGRLYDMRVTASGTLYQVARFLYELEKDPLALRLQEVTLRTDENQAGRELRLTAHFTGIVIPEDER